VLIEVARLRCRADAAANQVQLAVDRGGNAFGARHWQTREIYLERFKRIASDLGLRNPLSDIRQQVIGAHFCHEYSYAAAAIMNPSVVAAPEQSGLTDGAVRFIMSLRTVGEGHISSITFRTGAYSLGGSITIDPPSILASVPSVAMHDEGQDGCVEVECGDGDVSECVIFPVTPAQRNGLEDVRLVRFVDEDGSVTYLGTYTAYSGAAIRSELLTTTDFKRFTLQPLRGDAVRNKGMALFPRRIGGQFAMLGRQDNESIWYLASDDVHEWNGGVRVIRPRYPWELIQMGNCGPPIEIDEGWLVLTHGVGAVRNYSIGASLLDKNDPTKLLARTPRPLIRPDGEEREGYVPNVTYSCGAMVHGRTLLLPYALADSLTTFAAVPLAPLLASME